MARRMPFTSAERKEPTMETWMSAAMVVEATMLSILMALWIAWMSLRGLFRMLPAARLNTTIRGSGGTRPCSH